MRIIEEVVNIFVDMVREFLNEFITNIGFEFQLTPWMVVGIVVVALAILFPALIVAATIGSGMMIQNYFTEVDKGLSYLVGFIGVVVLLYVVVKSLAILYGKSKVSKRRLNTQDVLVYKILHKDLPRYNVTGEEFKKMCYSVFVNRRKVRKYIFTTDLNVHLPARIDEKTRELVVKLKEYVIVNNYHNLTQEQQRLLVNVQKINNPNLSNIINKQIELEQNESITQDDSVFLQKPAFDPSNPQTNAAFISYSGSSLFHRDELRERDHEKEDKNINELFNNNKIVFD